MSSGLAEGIAVHMTNQEDQVKTQHASTEAFSTKGTSSQPSSGPNRTPE